MSTSNVKTPILSCTGHISDWVEKYNEYALKNFFENELRNCNVQILGVSIHKNWSISVIFYKWMQISFLPYALRSVKLKHFAKFFYIASAKGNCINSGNTRYETFLRFNINSLQKSYIIRVKKQFNIAATYSIPLSIEQAIQKQIQRTGETIDVRFTNVYSRLLTGQNYRVLEPSSFLLYSIQLRPWGHFKFYIDAVNVFYLVGCGMSKVDIIVHLIKQAFARNSKKGQQRRFLQYLQKLIPTLLGYNKILVKLNMRIEVSGKFAVTGRTQKLVVKNKDCPLHTLDSIIDYAEGFVDTKAGTFSITVWCLKK